jgi:SAM-dependent methyltransferase
MAGAGAERGPAAGGSLCGVCGSGGIQPLLRFADYPAYLVPLPAAVAPGVRRAPLEAWHCLACGHLQQVAPDPALQQAIYAEYYGHYRVDSAEALVPHYREPFEIFVTAHAGSLPRGTLIEIGCSGGERVEFLARFAERYVGIDPSPRIAAARARHPAHRFIAGTFPDAIGDQQADVIVSQFNLEHIVDCGAFLDAAHELTRPDGILIVQVPDVAPFAERGQPNFLAHEHIHYFRRNALEGLLRRHGWRPLAWGPVGLSLIVAARRDTPETPPPADPAELDWSRQRRLFEARPRLPDGPIVFYGVGPLLFWMLGDGAPAGPVTIVDDNPAYHAMALPAYGWPVQRLAPELLAEATVVLSLNPVYHQTVIARLAAIGCRRPILAWADGGWQEIRLGD